MDDNDDADSVFKLITSLCEKFQDNPDSVKRARSKCYEILLGKRMPKQQKAFKELKGTNDPFCHILSWQLVLIHDYNLRDHADELHQCTETVKSSYGSKVDNCTNILKFLLSLRNVPTKDNRKLDLSSLPPIGEFENFNNLFKLPGSLVDEFEQHKAKSELSVKSKISIKKPTSEFNQLFALPSETEFAELFKDEGYDSPPKSPEENIWETVCKMKYSSRRNWENFGYPEPDKERPFLSELGDLSSLWVENLESLYLVKLFMEGTVFNSRLRSRRFFIRDLKYLLVGMASDTFGFDEDGSFYLMPGITVEGIAPDTLEKFCKGLLFSGTCYKALNRISIPDPATGKYKYDGYIFTEFCESINRYLKFYCTAVFNIPDSTSYLQFDELTYQLQLQISTIASICKVGPYKECEEMPHGVEILNYLYQKILNLSEEKVIIALYSILYSCFQVYFSRFLNRWIVDGIVNDPYGEFFIGPNSKYVFSRGRTYWTKGYSIQEKMIPDFLLDIKTELLHCGKTMSLLKQCVHSSKLCLYLMGRKPTLVSCCLTTDHLLTLRHNTTAYYLEVCSECPKFNLSEKFGKCRERDSVFLSLVAKKRAVTLRRLELERQKVIQEQNERKLEEIAMLKEQYDVALQQKQSRIAMEVEREMKQAEQNLEIELKRQRLIKDEAYKLVEYYSKLFEEAEEKKAKIDNYIRRIKSIHIDQSFSDKDKDHYVLATEHLAEKSNSSTESFYSVPDETEEKKPEENLSEPTHMHSSESMDIINANKDNETVNVDPNKNFEGTETIIISKNMQQTIENFAAARKNKHKVMTEEMGMQYFCDIEKNVLKPPTVAYLTDAQRNKLRILSSEFGLNLKPETFRTDRLTTAGLINRNRIMGVSNCLELKRLDNDSYINRNLRNLEDTLSKTGTIKKSKSLMLDFDKVKSGIDRPVPMSVDSTPLSDLPQSSATTPSTMFMSVDTNPLESVLTTADTERTEEDFIFEKPEVEKIMPIYYNREGSFSKMVFSKKVTAQEAAGVSTNCLKLFLYEGVQIPLVAHTELVDNELLRHFVDNLNYLHHLVSLRDYFFLQDGEFARNITENLFTKLYNANNPLELINCRTLQDLVFHALDMSGKEQTNSQFLSFKINDLPGCFDLGDPNVLDCLSLTYKVGWPLNILLPTDTLARYDEVFKYLLRLNRVSWVLKKIFLELKILAKETGKKEIYLMASPQYRKLHQCRHIMTHFIQTLQNYIVGEVLQTSWEMFEKNLKTVTNIDALYTAHISYIKNILFMCLLTQKSKPLMSVIHRIFTVILKFFDYLRSRSWMCVEGSYIHPNFKKLESIFRNFQELVQYLFKIGWKVSKRGYQPHLSQLLDMLDHNSYYSRLTAH